MFADLDWLARPPPPPNGLRERCRRIESDPTDAGRALRQLATTRLDGDQLGADPIDAWDAAVDASLRTFEAPGALDGTVSLASGPRPMSEYCWEMTTDALIHSWDLARGIGADEQLDPELTELVYERTLPIAEHLQETGMFKPPVPVADDAPLQTKLLALFGRRA